MAFKTILLLSEGRCGAQESDEILFINILDTFSFLWDFQDSTALGLCMKDVLL